MLGSVLFFIRGGKKIWQALFSVPVLTLNLNNTNPNPNPNRNPHPFNTNTNLNPKPNNPNHNHTPRMENGLHPPAKAARGRMSEKEQEFINS